MWNVTLDFFPTEKEWNEGNNKLMIHLLPLGKLYFAFFPGVLTTKIDFFRYFFLSSLLLSFNFPAQEKSNANFNLRKPKCIDLFNLIFSLKNSNNKGGKIFMGEVDYLLKWFYLLADFSWSFWGILKNLLKFKTII